MYGNADEVAKFLLGRGIPEDIVELPQRVLNSPIGQVCLENDCFI